MGLRGWRTALWSNPQVADQDVDLNPRKKPTYSEGQKRRAHQVGRVLYDNIVQLVNSGELSPQLANLSVDIVRVSGSAFSFGVILNENWYGANKRLNAKSCMFTITVPDTHSAYM